MYLAIHAVLFAAYILAVLTVLPARAHAQATPLSAKTILGAAVVFRLLLVPTTPSLSGDIYRYIWEGKLQVHGINPYLYSPSDSHLTSLRDHVYQGVNYKDLPAIYPPMMEWAFALAAFIHPSFWVVKLLFVSADVALIVLLCRLLRVRQRLADHVLLYAWNPLVIVEVASSGHNDPLAVLLLLAATLGIIGDRRVLSMMALGLSAASKIFPLLLAPLFVRRRWWPAVMIPPVVVAVAYLPYSGAGWNLVRSLTQYAERWRFNDSLFSLFERGIAWSGISPVAKGWADTHGVDSLFTQPHMLARGVAWLITLIVLARLARLRWRADLPIERALYLFTATMLLVQPTLHPWYLLWVLPWLALFPSPAWIALSGLIPLAYLGGTWVRWAEYVPFYALLLGTTSLRGTRWGHVLDWSGEGGS